MAEKGLCLFNRTYLQTQAKMNHSGLPGLIERIDKRKQELGFPSDQALCRAAGLDLDYMRVTIRRNKEPGAAKLLALARALQCTVSYLVEGEAASPGAFDERRMLDLLQATAAFALANPNALSACEFAELVIHLYHLNVTINVDRPFLSQVRDLLDNLPKTP